MKRSRSRSSPIYSPIYMSRSGYGNNNWITVSSPLSASSSSSINNYNFSTSARVLPQEQDNNRESLIVDPHHSSSTLGPIQQLHHLMFPPIVTKRRRLSNQSKRVITQNNHTSTSSIPVIVETTPSASHHHHAFTSTNKEHVKCHSSATPLTSTSTSAAAADSHYSQDPSHASSVLLFVLLPQDVILHILSFYSLCLSERPDLCCRSGVHDTSINNSNDSGDSTFIRQNRQDPIMIMMDEEPDDVNMNEENNLEMMREEDGTTTIITLSSTGTHSSTGTATSASASLRTTTMTTTLTTTTVTSPMEDDDDLDDEDYELSVTSGDSMSTVSSYVTSFTPKTSSLPLLYSSSSRLLPPNSNNAYITQDKDIKILITATHKDREDHYNRVQNYSSAAPVHILYTFYGYFRNDVHRVVHFLFPHIDISCTRLVYGHSMKPFHQLLPNISLLQSLDLSDNVIHCEEQLMSIVTREQPHDDTKDQHHMFYHEYNRLQRLNLSGNHKLSDEIFAKCILGHHWLSSHTLTSLDISTTSLTPGFICSSLLYDSVTKDRRFKNLNVLKMSHMHHPFHPSDVEHMLSYEVCKEESESGTNNERTSKKCCLLKGIQSLDLSYNCLTLDSWLLIVHNLSYPSSQEEYSLSYEEGQLRYHGENRKHSLQQLNLANNRINGSMNDYFDQLLHNRTGTLYTLKSCDLSGNSLSITQNGNSNRNFPQLNSLCLYRTEMNDETMDCLLSWFPNLQFLDISDNTAITRGLSTLFSAPGTKLGHINLNENIIGVQQWLENPPRITSYCLTVLELESCAITDDQLVHLLTSLSRMDSIIQSLRLERNDLSDTAFLVLCEHNVILPSLQKLVISRNAKLTHASADLLAKIFPNLTYLDCSQCNYNEESLVVLLNNLVFIQTLDMARNGMFMHRHHHGYHDHLQTTGIEGMHTPLNTPMNVNFDTSFKGKALLGSDSWDHAHSTMNSPISPISTSQLIKMIPKCLTELNLSGNRITDNFAIQLLQAHSAPSNSNWRCKLQSLDLQDNELTDRTVKYGILRSSPSHSSNLRRNLKRDSLVVHSLKYLDLSGNNHISNLGRDTLIDQCYWIDTLYCEIEHKNHHP